MGVHTTADDYRDKAREAINAAELAIHEFLLEVFIRKCWGHDEFRSDYEDEVREAASLMREIRKLVG